MFDDSFPRDTALFWVISVIPFFVMSNLLSLITASDPIAQGHWMGITLAVAVVVISVMGLGLMFRGFQERYLWGSGIYLFTHVCPLLPLSVLEFFEYLGRSLPHRHLPKEGFLFIQTLVISQVNVLICLAIGHIVVRHLRKRNLKRGSGPTVSG